jgi:hypothetical protein
MIGPIGPSGPHASRGSARGEARKDQSHGGPSHDGASHGDVVRYGSLEVPAKHAHDFETAAAYLSKDPSMAAILQKAQQLDHPLHLQINHHNDDSYDPTTNTVNWDPHSALETTDGGRQSPALGLGHELDHATVDAGVRVRGSWSFDAAYDNAEERRVVEGSEAHAAQTLGEDVRHDHSGSVYTVSSPILRRIA